ncbi:hypothetical protein FIBSPDRAFT_863664 [Athelia psychrophila]|uniref:Uncharacterized protein n=1 Tax=Athelia psychrophila TaxID=1759441 RepID=A0A166H2S3_9AGAM|nr:hypothetical protein FIBSPDRAFT_863664 [Fibularhizoctonia sp. CBS 109695]
MRLRRGPRNRFSHHTSRRSTRSRSRASGVSPSSTRRTFTESVGTRCLVDHMGVACIFEMLPEQRRVQGGMVGVVPSESGEASVLPELEPLSHNHGHHYCDNKENISEQYNKEQRKHKHEKDGPPPNNPSHGPRTPLWPPSPSSPCTAMPPPSSAPPCTPSRGKPPSRTGSSRTGTRY